MTSFELNLSAFGWGLGLVLLGWAAGLVVSYVFMLARSIGRV